MLFAAMPKTHVEIETLEKLVAPVCASEGVELVDLRLVPDGGLVLRVLIDVPNAETLPPGVGGVTLENCTRVSRALSPVLDDDAHADLLPSHYRLEVSSPGIERPLVKPRDFERFAGRKAHVQTNVMFERSQELHRGFGGFARRSSHPCAMTTVRTSTFRFPRSPRLTVIHVF